jgi:cytosine/adenosine deaminase-related metal-dependent hydrolase
MKAINSRYILTCNKSNDILENHSIVYDKKIVDILPTKELLNKYPNIETKDTNEHTIIIPGLINTHVHLEFSKNRTTLEYGDFVSWLKSVIINRDELIERVDEAYLSRVLDDMLNSGTTAIGAISSYGFEISACKKSPIRTTLFNEALGSKPDMIDDLYSLFRARLEDTKYIADERFTPAIAIHSPYSIHPILTKKVLQDAKDNDLLLTTHFMESPAEREWLENSQGDFLDFFKNFLATDKSLIKPIEFLKQFESHKTLFVHNTVATKDELSFIKNSNSSLVHCPVSNRFLTNLSLDLGLVDELGLEYSIGTDGLSSNISLSMFDELRAAMFTHTNQDINSLATKLLHSATNLGAKALGIDSGEISIGKNADFLEIDLPSTCEQISLATNIILHTKKPTSVTIGGLEYN